ncbi:DNA-binding bromodomain-containing protein [Raphanus sativus]|uniref:Uncharacterized protein LOC108806212 isoform X2 n=1 Tax=Raphanus sativus TaxID=3726 RepID=A0A9W3BZD4_RAPSA|nr:uncharacterized protein LOC108806212 isoform X2 [Raphanus sativus]KAJ4892303.1 DNA-binding bromodomain-containing protein [Raphanus sativus]
MTKEEAEASYSMNDDNDYICSNDDHNIRDQDDNNNNTKPKHESQAWGTWEELLLACAVKRHGFCDWDSVASEVRTRTSTSSPVFISPDSCRLKYRDLNRRFKEPTAAEEEEGGNDIPWLEELRSLRVAELRREVQEYDVSILSLQLKVKRLEEERDGSEKLDLEEEERKGERSENDGGEKAVSTAEESDRENRSMNESNSTGAGEKTVGGGDEPSRTRGDDLDPDPVNTAEEGSEASQSGELGESGTSGRKWKRKRRKDGDGEIRSAASKSQPLIRLLDLIRSHPRGSLFERRVRSQETEEYKSLVKQHLDIETIQRKLKQGSNDSSSLTFYRDLQLLFTNAITFFPSSSSESMAARELRAIVSEEMRKESGKSSPRLLKASGAIMTSSIKADAAETSEQKSSAPLVVCKRRRFASAKAKASSPSSSSFSQKEETKEEAVSEEIEDVETGGGRGSKRTANNTKTGKGKNKEKQTEAKTEKKVVASSDKKKSVADFLKRIKKSSPQKEDKDQNKSKKESKPKPRELRSNNVGKGRKKAEVENTTTPAKRAPGRPPQKKTVEATATASGKRGRESGSTGKDNKQPKKRSRR